MSGFQQFLGLIRRYPLVTVCTVLVIGLGIGSYFLWESQQQLAVGHDSVRRNGEDMLLSLSGLPRVSSELTTVKEAVEFIDANLVKEGDLAENLGYFYQLETLSRVHLTQVGQLSSQPAGADAAFIAVPFSVRATGSYRQIMRFIHELETGPRVCRITTYTLSGGDNDSVQLDLSLEMLGRP
jgi:Tfp pilus assembly protein PilO